MQPVLINNEMYYSSSDVAELWGVKESTVKRYAAPGSGKIRGAIKQGKRLLIPANTIRPITKPIAQGLLWGLLEIKNNPAAFLDLTEFSIDNAQIESVLKELVRQQYIQLPDCPDNLRDALERAFITEKGFGLIRYKQKLSDSPLQGLLTAESLIKLFEAVQTLVQLAKPGT